MSASATITTTIGLKLQPLDVLFFRDGRPFITGNEYMVSGLPMPQTFAGAIRTALLRAAGCDFPQLGKLMKGDASFADAVQQACPEEYHWIGEVCVRGPWLARCKADGTIDLLVPTPAILHREKKNRAKLHRLNPLRNGQLPGWNPPAGQEGLRPLWLKEPVATEPVEGFLTSSGFEKFLHGGVPEPDDVVSASELYDIDRRTGIGISPDRLVAAESQIFGRGFLALKDSVFLYGEVLLPEGADSSFFENIELLPFGGEGRHVRLRRLGRPFGWPAATPRESKEKPLVVLTTPCAFAAGWKPHHLDGQIVAAAVPGSVAFSGWDLARGGPKPTRFGVLAGSTYFLESELSHWPVLSLAESEGERQQGWGCYLRGVWTDD